MADINLITFDSSTVTPQHDALMANAELTGNGILYGCGVSRTNDTTLSIDHGVGVIYGREFEIDAHTITIEKSGSGTLNGQLYIRMNLGDVNPISIETDVRSGALKTLIDNPDCNLNNTETDIQLCTFQVDGQGIVNDSVVNTMPTITGVPDALAAIQGSLSSTNTNLTALSGKTAVHIVTSATANLNGPSYRDDQRVFYFSQAVDIRNGPSGVYDGFLIILKGGNCTKQIFLRFGTMNTNDHETYIRTYTSYYQTWSSWEKLSTFGKTEDITITLKTGWSKSWSGAGVYFKQAATSMTEISSVSVYDFKNIHKMITPYIDRTTNQVGVICESNSGFGDESWVRLRVVGR